MSQKISDTFLRAVEQGGQLRVRSALNPLLWLCAVISTPLLAACVLSGNQPIFVWVLGFSPVALAMGAYIFFLIFDRDRLQSEEYQIKKQSLEMIGQSNHPDMVFTDDVELIEDPSTASQ